jgi:phospholipid transport system substrate-binding protein
VKTLTSKLLLIFIIVTSIAFEARAEEEDPVSLVISTSSSIFTNLEENLEAYEADPTKLQDLIRSDLLPMLDIHYSARLILGRAGRGIEPQKVDAFAEAMINLLVTRYSVGLLQFRSTEQLRVLPQRGDLNEKLTRVRTRIRLPQGGEAPIDYAFHKTKEGWKAFDLIVEGISYVTTYRNQIMPEVKANGIDSVIERLNSGEMKLAD